MANILKMGIKFLKLRKIEHSSIFTLALMQDRKATKYMVTLCTFKILTRYTTNHFDVCYQVKIYQERASCVCTCVIYHIRLANPIYSNSAN